MSKKCSIFVVRNGTSPSEYHKYKIQNKRKIMKKVVFEKDKMLFFNMENFVQDADGVMVYVFHKKHLIHWLCGYVSANGMEDVDFTWQGGGSKFVTLWCHHHTGDLTNIYLVGVMPKECWLNCGWYEDTTNPMKLHMGWNKETKVFDLEDGIQKVLDKKTDLVGVSGKVRMNGDIDGEYHYVDPFNE